MCAYNNKIRIPFVRNTSENFFLASMNLVTNSANIVGGSVNHLLFV
jgi:hypothetical protein